MADTVCHDHSPFTLTQLMTKFPCRRPSPSHTLSRTMKSLVLAALLSHEIAKGRVFFSGPLKHYGRICIDKMYQRMEEKDLAKQTSDDIDF